MGTWVDGLSWPLTYSLLVLIYVLIHYLFVSQSAHLLALFGVFLGISQPEVPLPLMVDIRDGPKWIRDRFLRYLGRPPTSSEVSLYKKAMAETLSPQLVARPLNRRLVGWLSGLLAGWWRLTRRVAG